jgi:hypothetical protein
MLPEDSPWAADAWQRKAEALTTAVSIGQSKAPVSAGVLREAARRGASAGSAAAALFGTASPSAPCEWDFGPMLQALEVGPSDRSLF